MKNKDYSKYGKLLIVALATAACILKWCGILSQATVTEIWQTAYLAYGLSLGTMDFNIIVDSWKGR